HRRLLEIPGDAQDEAARREVLPVKGDQVLARDARHGLDGALPAQRVVGSVEQLPELAPGDPGRAVWSAADGLQGLAPSELHFGGLEGGSAKHVGEDGQHLLKVLLQYVLRGCAALAAD